MNVSVIYWHACNYVETEVINCFNPCGGVSTSCVSIITGHVYMVVTTHTRTGKWQINRVNWHFKHDVIQLVMWTTYSCSGSTGATDASVKRSHPNNGFLRRNIITSVGSPKFSQGYKCSKHTCTCVLKLWWTLCLPTASSKSWENGAVAVHAWRPKCQTKNFK